ncbi:MAG: V-type ATPase subunit [Treponema sp.]|nr:V-type ATPase subunit [Treponema sp.]
MDRSSASAFVNAKAGGMLKKSFIGERAAKLFSVSSLSELWGLLFTQDVPAVPEVLLAQQIEKKASNVFIKDYIKLLSNYSHPSQLLVDLVTFYEYDNLKEIIAALVAGKKELPALVDVGSYKMLHYEKWPNIAAMTADTPFAWCSSLPDVTKQQHLNTKLDIQYLHTIWSSLHKIPNGEREPIKNLVVSEYGMYNVIWALRLKVYYDMKPDQIVSLLVFTNSKKEKDDPFVADAMEILDKDINNYADWADWRYARFLNPHEEGVVWTLDPRWVEQAYKKDLNQQMMRKFHQYPLTDCVLYTWFKIKMNEVATIRTATEMLRLNVDKGMAMSFAGVAAN